MAALVLFGLPLSVVPRANAAGNSNQFGGQDRAAAAAQMIVLGVQQGISSLPPTSGQSFAYQFDPASDTYVRSEQLGPTSFRSPQTVGPGKFSFRLATSYFELADTKAPIPYLVSSPPGTALGVGALGLQADAKVALVNLSANYGFTNRVEVTMNLPVVVVDASAKQIFSTSQPTGPPQQAPFSGTPIVTDSTGKPDLAASVGLLNQAIQAGALHLRKESLSALGFSFNDGTHVGVGRISLGVKGVLYADKIVQLAAAPEFYFPSPNQGEFAGSDSAAILPRLVAAFRLADAVRLHIDAGYDYDFDKDELRRFVWNLGPSLALGRATVDAGVGGSKFNTGIKWTPTTAPFVDNSGNPGSIRALGDNRLGSNFIDALGAVKVRLGTKSVLSGAVNVPLNNEGFRAAAVGTLAVELHL
ncbi:MAG: transporter [Candidatus Binatia bacterium]|jgi:hypothetical protein